LIARAFNKGVRRTTSHVDQNVSVTNNPLWYVLSNIRDGARRGQSIQSCIDTKIVTFQNILDFLKLEIEPYLKAHRETNTSNYSRKFRVLLLELDIKTYQSLITFLVFRGIEPLDLDIILKETEES